MYLEGGLYVDADSLPGEDVQDFLKVSDGNVWISAMTQVPNCVAMNWFIAAPAQDNLIGEFLETALRNVASPEGRGIFWLAGPGALTQALYELGEVEGLQILSNHQLKAGLFRQIDAACKKTEKIGVCLSITKGWITQLGCPSRWRGSMEGDKTWQSHSC